MHNSTFSSPGKGLRRTGPLKRSAFKTKPDAKRLTTKKPLGAPAKPKTAAAPPKPRSALKSSRPATSKIRQSARHETCTLRLFRVCRPEPGNVVWAHSNHGEHGKGGGLKAEDQYGCYACFWCHGVYDRQHPRPPGMSLEDVEQEFTRAMAESRAILIRKGLLVAPDKPLEV
jgi:hypothetical protein